MRITKLEHATLILEIEGSRVVIDPGSFTPDLGDVSKTVAIVITHLHQDHWTPDHLRSIIAINPGVKIFGPPGVATAAKEFPVSVVNAGDKVSVGGIDLEFFGGVHAVIHSSIPLVENLGVLVNGLYYPGDSFSVPGVPVQVLAAPAGAPWLRIGEAMDFVLEVSPKQCFPTHQAVLSQAGMDLANARLGWATEQGGGVYVPLITNETLEIG